MYTREEAAIIAAMFEQHISFEASEMFLDAYEAASHIPHERAAMMSICCTITVICFDNKVNRSVLANMIGNDLYMKYFWCNREIDGEFEAIF